MTDVPQSAPSRPNRRRRLISTIEPALRVPLASALAGILAAVGLAIVLPPVLALPFAVGVMGLASLSALMSLDAQRRRDLDAVARNVGELNVRLGATRIKLDGLRSRIDSEPLREADIAPTRSSLAELTAEVGLLGGVLRDVANAVSEHEEKLARAQPLADAAPQPGAAPGSAGSASASGGSVRGGVVLPAADAIALVAQPDQRVDASLKRRDEERLAAVVSAFANGGIEVHLQPVAALPQRRTVGYEALARLRLADGSLLLPSEFVMALERAGHGAGLDAQVLTQVLAICSHLNARAQDQFVSLNLSGGTWGEARALGSIARVLEAYRAQATRLVIEIPQRVWRTLDPARLGIVGGMAANGVRFAIDQVSDLRVDPVALADRGVRFLKVPALMLAGLGEQSSGLDIAAGDVSQLLRRAGIELIGERAETDRLVADLIDLDIRLAQGFAISQPRPIKPEVFLPQDQKQAAADGSPSSADPDALVDSLPVPARSAVQNVAAPAEVRVPFRAVLRRA
jgi:cyclic-di-GMP phosphodiesterase TipF (flagellum assembly factor)